MFYKHITMKPQLIKILVTKQPKVMPYIMFFSYIICMVFSLKTLFSHRLVKFTSKQTNRLQHLKITDINK